MKRKKHKWAIFSLIFLSILVFVVWLFQTHNPSEKVYSTDKQYSYHLEEYNFNKIMKELPYHETIYKIFLHDEIMQKTLYTKYLGGQTYMRDYFGFSDEDNRLYFDKTDYYELPRPINTVEQQESKSLPLISNEKAVWETEYIGDELYLIRGKGLDSIKNDIHKLIDSWNKYNTVKMKFLKTEGNIIYLTIPDATYLTQQLGTTGAVRVLASLTYTLTENKRYSYIYLDFIEGDHAAPGKRSREDFTHLFTIYKESAEK